MKKIMLTLLLLSVTFAATAQRTAKDEMFLKVNYVYPFNSALGASLGWGMYKMGGYWEAELNGCDRYYSVEGSEERLRTRALEGRGGYMCRLVSKRDRSVNLYAGGGAILGFRQMKGDEVWKIINESTGTSYAGELFPFEFGFYPKVELELFFSRNAAVNLGAVLPVTFFGKSDYKTIQKLTGVIHYEAFVGLKFNF